MIKLVEIIQAHKDQYSMREIFINPVHVVYLREDSNMKSRLDEGKLPESLDTRQSFTKIKVHNGATGTEFVVVGTPAMVEAKLRGKKKEVLCG
tara:strand:+ start:359 stop:637 length:279 start_codon:yes stop_codon:yes gene_type:complete